MLPFRFRYKTITLPKNQIEEIILLVSLIIYFQFIYPIQQKEVTIFYTYKKNFHYNNYGNHCI